MKTSIKKLQKFATVRQDKRSQKHHQYQAQDELARATQDMHDMRDCYDKLLSAAAATANSVYEFSESLREMGDCLLEKTALNDDEESGKVLLMLGKVQFELQKLFDSYRSHIIQTITVPSESLLNELRIVEEMKRRSDEKRDIFEDLVKKQKEKGRLRNSKGEFFISPQVQEAQDEYNEETNVFIFRMKSLKQGQSRSFLTQASRHHAAQFYFFKAALSSLETIEPHVKLLAEQLHIDYHFSELNHDVQESYDDDDESEVDNDADDGSETQDNGNLSFDHGHNSPVQENLRINRMEGISVDRHSLSVQRGIREISKSAPLFPEKKLDSAERMAQLGHSSSRKFTSYVLPTPDEAKSPVSRKLGAVHVPQTTQAVPNIWHSSPLDQKKNEKFQSNEKFSGPIILETLSMAKESNSTSKSRPLPPPLAEGFSLKNLDRSFASYAKKAKRQSFSGPLTRRPWPNHPNFTASGPIVPSAFPMPYSGPLLRTPVAPVSSTPIVSSRLSTSMASSPVISELHELPLPPGHFAGRRPHHIAHSGPLISRNHEFSAAYAPTPTTSIAASTLPMPPLGLSRSYSIPAGGSTDVAAEDAPSPPLTPISLQKNIPPSSKAS